MLKTILVIVVIFLSAVGLGDLLHRLWIILIRPKKSHNYLITLLCDEFAVEQVSALLEDIRWQGKDFARILVGVDMGLTPVVSETLKTLEKNSDDFVYLKAEQLPQYILSTKEI